MLLFLDSIATYLHSKMYKESAADLKFVTTNRSHSSMAQGESERIDSSAIYIHNNDVHNKSIK